MQIDRATTLTSQRASNERVSVIVPTFNRAALIGPCLESLLDQTVPAAEIIVVDDGSEDATREVVGHYKPRVTYLRKENGGKPNAFNYGLDHASGNLIWLFDDDDIALPNAIETRLRTLSEHRSAGFVYAPHHVADDYGDGVLHIARTNHVPEHSDSFLFDLMCGCFFHLNSCLILREQVVLLDGLDPQLKAGEDYDFQIRLARRCTGVQSPDAVFTFRRHGGLRGDKSIRYTSEDRDYVFRQFDILVGQKIRREFHLGDFLVPSRSYKLLQPSECRRALVGRAMVMASKGCIPEMLEDLNEAIALADRTNGFGSNELEMVSHSMHVGYSSNAIYHNWASFWLQLKRFSRTGHGRLLCEAVSKGLARCARSFPGDLMRRGNIARRALQTAFLVQVSRYKNSHQ